MVKRAWPGAILGWVTPWEVLRVRVSEDISTLKRLVLVCGASRQTWSTGCYNWYQSRPSTSTVCGSGMNQAEAGGHVIPGAEEGGE